MIIEKLAVGPLESNCYIAVCSNTKQATVIDPGADGSWILDHVRKAEADVIWIVNTHGHGDHIGANAELKAAFPKSKVAIHKEDALCLTDPALNFSEAFGFPIVSPPADVLLTDGQELQFGHIILKVLHVPGHSAGGIALYWQSNADTKPVLFSGDILFAGSVGRADLPGGDHEQLIEGIHSKLLTLPPETVVYPGHGERTTIGREAKMNPFL